MSSSSRKKRPKSIHRNPNPTSTSTSNSFLSVGFLKEPPPSFFPSKDEFFRLLGVIAIAVSVAAGCNYTVNILIRQPKPFCDSDDPLPDFCEPCPKYGECCDGNLQCLPGYRKHGRSCVEDGEINQTAKKLSEWVEHRVCEAYAQFLCEKTGTVWVDETKMWKEMDEFKLMGTLGLESDSYAYTKQKTKENIEGSIETRTNIHGNRELKCPDQLVDSYKPLICHIQLWVTEHALYLVPFFVLLAGLATLCMSIIRRVRRRRYLSTRAEELYHQVCEILEENAMVEMGVSGEGEPWVVASRLRDHLLLPKERKDPSLWKKVEDLVLEDSRLDQYPKLVKGESKVVWEWQVEGSLSSSRKRTKGSASKLGTSEDQHKFPFLQRQTPKVGEMLNY